MKYVDNPNISLCMPLNSSSVVREINKINERELELGTSGSWHDDYKGEYVLYSEAAHSDPLQTLPTYSLEDFIQSLPKVM